MREPQSVPDLHEVAVRWAAQALVTEYFSRLDTGDLDGAVALYAPDAVFLAAHGRVEIRSTVERGLAANADRRSRHVIANLRADRDREGRLVVEYTALAYTLDGEGPLAPRTIYDQLMYLGQGADGSLSISEHRIPAFDR